MYLLVFLSLPMYIQRCETAPSHTPRFATSGERAIFLLNRQFSNSAVQQFSVLRH
jgi:hypothetical protein